MRSAPFGGCFWSTRPRGSGFRVTVAFCVVASGNLIPLPVGKGWRGDEIILGLPASLGRAGREGRIVWMVAALDGPSGRFEPSCRLEAC